MRTSSVLALLLPAVSAHFTLNYPEARGESTENQADSPCGGYNSPSSERTKWPMTGGQLSFEAGHDEANTAVYIALGNNPKAEDFTVVVADKFLQVGMGTFCWNSLELPADLKIKDGDNATIQVIQEGHSGGGLYNCADITFSKAAIDMKACSNGTGISAEAAVSHSDEDDHGHDASASASGSPSETGSGAAASSSAADDSGAGALRVAGGAVVAGIVGAAAWLL